MHLSVCDEEAVACAEKRRQAGSASPAHWRIPVACRPRLLFQHRPYSEQERLDLSDAEIAAIVEAVLGVVDGPGLWGVSPNVPAPSPKELLRTHVTSSRLLPSLMPMPCGRGRFCSQDKDILDVQQNGGRGSKQNEQPGRVCANILIKLLLDLWTLNDAAFSFPLALMLLYGCAPPFLCSSS